uniref:Uncharacterized protein n=1 Tax=Chenopodium quinoa TaxID=63459 RepID=A0A803LC42_CHEQI
MSDPEIIAELLMQMSRKQCSCLSRVCERGSMGEAHQGPTGEEATCRSPITIKLARQVISLMMKFSRHTASAALLDDPEVVQYDLTKDLEFIREGSKKLAASANNEVMNKLTADGNIHKEHKINLQHQQAIQEYKLTLEFNDERHPR